MKTLVREELGDAVVPDWGMAAQLASLDAIIDDPALFAFGHLAVKRREKFTISRRRRPEHDLQAAPAGEPDRREQGLRAGPTARAVVNLNETRYPGESPSVLYRGSSCS